MAGPTGSLKGVTGSVEEPLVQEVMRESCVGSVSVWCMLVDSLFVSCESPESLSAMETSSACWRGSSEMVPTTE